MAEAAVGVALGICPLIISAIENYEYTFRPIIIFTHRSGKEVKRLFNTLRVSMCRFLNRCEFLLHSVTSNKGTNMINDTTHALWQDDQLETRLRRRLSDSFDACVGAMELINDLATQIVDETKNPEKITEEVGYSQTKRKACLD